MPRGSRLDGAERGVAQLNERTELRELRAHQREVVALVEVAETADPIGAGAAVQLEPQRIAGIGGICDQRVIAEHGDDLGHQTRLRVAGMHVEIPPRSQP